MALQPQPKPAGLMGAYGSVSNPIIAGSQRAVADAVAFRNANTQLRTYQNTDRSQGGSGEGVHNMGASAAGHNMGPSVGTLIRRERSRLEGVQNPYGADYGKGLLGGYVSNINQGYAQNQTGLREQMAARGLSQAGMSGIEAQGVQQNNLARTNAMVNARNFTDTTVREKAADFDMRRNQALDSFYQAQRSQDINAARQAVDAFMAMAQNERQQELHPGVLRQQGLMAAYQNLQNQDAQTRMQFTQPMLQAELDRAIATNAGINADLVFKQWTNQIDPTTGKRNFEVWAQRAQDAGFWSGALPAIGQALPYIYEGFKAFMGGGNQGGNRGGQSSSRFAV